jgi:hypothetical protein
MRTWQHKDRSVLDCARMMHTDRKGGSVVGLDFLLPNATNEAIGARGVEIDGVTSACWVLGDAGHVALQLVAVDIQSLRDWMDAHGDCGIVCQYLKPFGGDNRGEHGAVARDIYATARLIYRTKDPGKALQPGWEFAKQAAENLGSFAGPQNEIVDGLTALSSTIVGQYDMHKKPRLTPGQVKLNKAKAAVAQRRDDDALDIYQAKVWVAIEFSMEGKQRIGDTRCYFRQRNSPEFRSVMDALEKIWAGV